jgi:hypothetical protein
MMSSPEYASPPQQTLAQRATAAFQSLFQQRGGDGASSDTTQEMIKSLTELGGQPIETHVSFGGATEIPTPKEEKPLKIGSKVIYIKDTTNNNRYEIKNIVPEKDLYTISQKQPSGEEIIKVVNKSEICRVEPAPASAPPQIGGAPQPLPIQMGGAPTQPPLNITVYGGSNLSAPAAAAPLPQPIQMGGGAPQTAIAQTMANVPLLGGGTPTPTAASVPDTTEPSKSSLTNGGFVIKKLGA